MAKLILPGGFKPPEIIPYWKQISVDGRQDDGNTTLPTGGIDTTPGYHPILSGFDYEISAIIVCGGNVTPTDGVTSRLRLWLHEGINSTRLVGAYVASTVQNFQLSALGHVRMTDGTLLNTSSLHAWGALCTLSAVWRIKANQLYFIGSQWEGNFAGGGNVCGVQRGPGLQMRKLSAGVQPFGYTPTDNPTTTSLVGGDGYNRWAFLMKTVQ